MLLFEKQKKKKIKNDVAELFSSFLIFYFTFFNLIKMALNKLSDSIRFCSKKCYGLFCFFIINFFHKLIHLFLFKFSFSLQDAFRQQK